MRHGKIRQAFEVALVHKGDEMSKVRTHMPAMLLIKRRARKGLIALMFCASANALTPSESAQFSIFAIHKALELTVQVCEKENSRASALLERYQQTFGDHINAALTRGKQLAAQRGQNFEDAISRLAHEQVAKFGATRDSCENSMTEIEKRLGWTFQHYLDLEYAEWMREAGNAIGYPCEWSDDLAARTVKGFLESGIDFTDAKFVTRASLLLEADRALQIVGLCERAQARAPEFGVAAMSDYRDVKQALSLIVTTLRLVEPDRQKRLDAAIETVRNFSLSRLR
jgi:hypothetical protein